MRPESMLTDFQRSKLWEFVRGDADTGEFETWLYDDATLEATFENETYLELIGCNFHSHEDVVKIKELVRSILEAGERCRCAGVRNLDSIEMGDDWFFEKFFATMSELARPETDQWWMYISRCVVCGTNWLVAQEERIHDQFYVQRISDQIVEKAKEGNWPDQFQTYADVLEIGVKLGVSQSVFVDPMSGALQVTVKELLQTNPDISSDEVGKKLGIDTQHAQLLMTTVNKDEADPMAGYVDSKKI